MRSSATLLKAVPSTRHRVVEKRCPLVLGGPKKIVTDVLRFGHETKMTAVSHASAGIHRRLRSVQVIGVVRQRLPGEPTVIGSARVKIRAFVI